MSRRDLERFRRARRLYLRRIKGWRSGESLRVRKEVRP